MVESKREQLISTALHLFEKNGYRATGIDTILAEAGVAKMTLYHHFKSKDELIAAALQRRDREWRNWFTMEVEKRGQSPRDRLLAIFDVLETWFRRRDFHGCSFSRAATEFRERDHAVHELAAEHKRAVTEYIRGIAADAKASHPKELAEHLCLLIEGASINMELFGKCAVAQSAKRAAEHLINAALRGNGN